MATDPAFSSLSANSLALTALSSLSYRPGTTWRRRGTVPSRSCAIPATKAITRLAAAGHTSGEEGSNDPDDDFLYVALPVQSRHQARVAAPSLTHGPDVVLLVAESATVLHARIRSHWITLGLFGVGVLAVATGLGTILARSLTRPLERIETAVAAVGAGRLSERAPIGRGPAELNALGETVNEMADRFGRSWSTPSERSLPTPPISSVTPLTALRLRLENLEGTLDPNSEPISRLPSLKLTGFSRIVDGLLTLARAEGGVRPTREAVDVGAALRDRAEA